VNPHLNVRGRGLRLAALAACLATTGTAYAAATPSGGKAAEGGNVTISGAGGTKRVSYGERVRFAGAVAPRTAGRDVKLEYQPSGRDWRPVAKSKTAGNGGYRFSVRARQSGAYRATGENGPSAERRVTVRAHVTAKGKRHVMGTHSVRVRGTVKPSLSGRKVSLQRRVHGHWRSIDRARTGRGGRFSARFRPHGAGSYRLRVKFGGDRANGASSRKLRRINVYRPGQASFYGPGLYGGKLACGGTLTPSKIGVANKRLPCGTKVTFRYHGRSVTAPVVDRGPYSGSREWDLTTATKRKLGFGSTGTVWSTK
jgi:hypothetical protein